MERKRLFLSKKTGRKQRIEIIKWAASNSYDAIVFPLNEKLSVKSEYVKLAKKYDLIIETGGHELSFLLPRHLYMFNKDLFRMEQGKRKMSHHFCPTNPKSTAIFTERAKKLFARSMLVVTPPRVFHLFPDEGFENTWCACPACRAFSPSEQNIIAVSCAADALFKLDPDAKISYLDLGTEPEKAEVQPRKNMFKQKEVKQN